MSAQNSPTPSMKNGDEPMGGEGHVLVPPDIDNRIKRKVSSNIHQFEVVVTKNQFSLTGVFCPSSAVFTSSHT
jgi:hypothetical protein